MKKAIILGSSGSIGVQALQVCDHLGMEVTAISGRNNVDLLERQIRRFKPMYCGVSDSYAASVLSGRIADLNTKIISGDDASSVIASESEGDIILNAVSGVAGLKPTISAIESRRMLALANKESLVTAGNLIKRKLEKHSSGIIPVDSEHSAIFQCLSGNKIKKIILTASGGPFFGRSFDELKDVKASDALNHPTWNMGSRITVDSSTMMNKGFEVIEASHLFDVSTEQIDVIVHRESIVHSMVEYEDNAVIAQMGTPDMRTCIQYAFTYPERRPSLSSKLDLSSVSSLSFHRPDFDAFPLLRLAYDVYSMSESSTAALNGADEEAVSLFLKGMITYPQLVESVIYASLNSSRSDITCYGDVLEADSEGRRLVRNYIGVK